MIVAGHRHNVGLVCDGGHDLAGAPRLLQRLAGEDHDVVLPVRADDVEERVQILEVVRFDDVAVLHLVQDRRVDHVALVQQEPVRERDLLRQWTSPPRE